MDVDTITEGISNFFEGMENKVITFLYFSCGKFIYHSLQCLFCLFLYRIFKKSLNLSNKRKPNVGVNRRRMWVLKKQSKGRSRMRVLKEEPALDSKGRKIRELKVARKAGI